MHILVQKQKLMLSSRQPFYRCQCPGIQTSKEVKLFQEYKIGNSIFLAG